MNTYYGLFEILRLFCCYLLNINVITGRLARLLTAIRRSTVDCFCLGAHSSCVEPLVVSVEESFFKLSPSALSSSLLIYR